MQVLVYKYTGCYIIFSGKKVKQPVYRRKDNKVIFIVKAMPEGVRPQTEHAKAHVRPLQRKMLPM